MAHKLPATVAVAITMIVGVATSEVAVAQTGEISWTEDTQLAMAQARETGLPIIVYATSDHCGYCRKMERESWSNAAIIRQVEAGFVPLRANSRTNAALVAQLHVRAFPTTVLISPDGKVITGAEGYLPPGRLAGLMRSIRPAETAVARPAIAPR